MSNNDATQAIIDALRLDSAERALRAVAAEYGRTGKIDPDALRLTARHVRMAQDAIERHPNGAGMRTFLALAKP